MSVQSKMLPIALGVLVLGALGLLAGTQDRADQPSVDKTAHSKVRTVANRTPPLSNAAARKPAAKSDPPATDSAAPVTSRPIVTRTSRAAEQAIRRALQTKIDVKFKQTPLKDVLSFLAKKGEFNLIIEREILKDEGISLDEPIADDLKQVTIRQVLDWTLPPLGLTWVIEDEVLKVTTEAEADEKLYTRTYNVKTLLDLHRRYLKAHPERTAPHVFGGGGGFFSVRSDVSPTTDTRPRTALFQFISGGTTGGLAGLGRGRNPNDPGSWLQEVIESTTSGRWEAWGTLKIVNNVLAVRQTQNVHEEVAGLLRALEGMAAGKAKLGVIAMRPAVYPQASSPESVGEFWFW